MRKPIGFIKKVFSTITNTAKKNELANLTVFVILYGLLLNYICFVLFGVIFKWYTFLGYGLAWYFVKYELVRLFHMFRRNDK